MIFLIAFPALIAGLYLGEYFPDIDQRVGFLRHRSILTHGLLAPVALYLAASNTHSIPFRWFAMGVFLGVAVHLAFDLFPRAWTGFALVSIPFYGWIPAPLSWSWIALSGLACLYLGARLVLGFREASLWAFGLIGVFVYAAQGEDALWRPMAAIAGGVVIAVAAAVVAPASTD